MAQLDVVLIDKNVCVGCEECKKVCPVDAISGQHGEPQVIDAEKCVMCGQCVQKCKSYVSIVTHGYDAYDKVRKERNIPETVNEPLFAAYNVTHIEEVEKALADPKKFVMVQSAPAVRVALAEEFGFELGSCEEKKMAAALRKIGFDKVYDTDFSADLTIMEEGSELIQRVTTGKGKLPMFTSCCPAWVTFFERNYPEFTEHLSSCRSPQQMLGSIFKTYGADVEKKTAKDVYSVSVMPCTCKEFEARREEMNASGERDVDTVLTTRELAWLIKAHGIDFKSLPDEEYDQLLGDYTGAAVIFGVGGGVMEAALRTGYELITKKKIPDVEILSVRNEGGFKTSLIQCGDLTLKVGVVTGLRNVKDVMEKLKAGQLNDYHFIEVMTCPSGCISGGGQPKLLEDTDIPEAYNKRREATYQHDRDLKLRKSHENPHITKIYEEYFKAPLGEKSHHLLHTHYTKGKANTV